MKFLPSLLTVGVSVCAVTLFTSPVRAYDVIEDFAYTPGLDLDGLDGGANWAGAWDGSLTPQITAGSLTFPGQTVTGNKVSLGYDGTTYNIFRSLDAINESTATTVTVSFLFNLSGDDADTGIRFTGLSLFNGGTEQLFLGKPGNTTEVGFEKYAGGNQVEGVDASFDSGTVFRFQAVITFNPTGDDLLSVTIEDNSGAVDQTWSNLSLGSNFQFDSIRIDRDFALDSDIEVSYDEVTVNVVPEPTTAVLAVGGILAALGLRRRR